jgi:hypothetical protein
MSIRSPTKVLAVLTVVVATVAGGCYWLRYHDLLETHLGLMQGLAADAGASLAAGEGLLRPADIERLRYPLERARQFVAISRPRFAGRASLARFEVFVEGYGELVDDLDRARVKRPRVATLAATRRQIARLDDLADEVRAAVAAERAG